MYKQMLTNVKQAISHDIVNVLTTIFTFYNGYLKYLQNILIIYSNKIWA